MLCKSLPKSKLNRFPPRCNLVSHTGPHITRCFDFLPFCLSTQLTTSPPAYVIRAECINLVFIYSPWMRHGPTKLEILLLFGSVLYHRWHFLFKSGDLFLTSLLWSWENSFLEVTPTSACELALVSQPLIRAAGCHVRCLKTPQTAAANKFTDGLFDGPSLTVQCLASTES